MLLKILVCVFQEPTPQSPSARRRVARGASSSRPKRGRCGRGRGQRWPAPAASLPGWSVKQPQSDATGTSTWLPVFSQQRDTLVKPTWRMLNPTRSRSCTLQMISWKPSQSERTDAWRPPARLQLCKTGSGKYLKEVSAAEMKRFIGVYFWMGAMDQRKICDHSQKSTIWTAHHFMRRLWTGTAGKKLSQLHFVDNSEFVPRGQLGHDRSTL